jgi:hypothetical protein
VRRLSLLQLRWICEQFISWGFRQEEARHVDAAQGEAAATDVGRHQIHEPPEAHDALFRGSEGEKRVLVTNSPSSNEIKHIHQSQ